MLPGDSQENPPGLHVGMGPGQEVLLLLGENPLLGLIFLIN